MHLEFKIPMLWLNPGEHNEQNCYFCVNKVTASHASQRKSFTYVSTDYTELPKPHEPNDTPPKYEEQSGLAEQMDQMEEIEHVYEDAPSISLQEAETTSYVPPPGSNIPAPPSLVNKSYLNHMCRSLGLSQRKSIILARLLKYKNLLTSDVAIYSQKHRQARFIPLFKTENDLSYCTNIDKLMEELHIQYIKEDWRIFIDSSKSGLKVVLLHNDNAFMPVAIAYSRVLKETHDTMKLVFQKIGYNNHQWDFSGDFKVIALVMGLQLGRTRNSCFICTWISTAKIPHYSAQWEHRSSYEIGSMNVVRNCLVPREKILLPPLHIKLGIITQFIKKLTISPDGNAFQYICLFCFPN